MSQTTPDQGDTRQGRDNPGKEELFSLSGLARPVAFRNSGEIIAVLEVLFRGWRLQPLAPGDDSAGLAPALVVSNTGKRFQLEGITLDKAVRYRDPVDTACAVIANLAKAQTFEDPDTLVFHGAGVAFEGALTLFPSDFRAGKSILTSVLASRGHRVFSDDIVLYRPAESQGIAAGWAPRLRLPLPDVLGEETRAFIDKFAGPKSERYLYLDLPDEIQAPRGEATPIDRIVLLARDEKDIPARLSAISGGEALKHVIQRNFARVPDASSVLDRLFALSASVACYRLAYSDPEEAADLLGASRRTEPGASPRGNSGTGQGQAMAVDGNAEPLLRGMTVTRLEPRHRRDLDGEIFLVTPDDTEIVHLDSLSGAVWNFLGTPRQSEDLYAIFAAAFPDVTPSRLETDISGLLRRLRDRGLMDLQ